jgi:hypothetical protein
MQDFLGELRFMMSELVTAPGKHLVRRLDTRSAHQSTASASLPRIP